MSIRLGLTITLLAGLYGLWSQASEVGRTMRAPMSWLFTKLHLRNTVTEDGPEVPATSSAVAAKATRFPVGRLALTISFSGSAKEALERLPFAAAEQLRYQLTDQLKVHLQRHHGDGLELGEIYAARLFERRVKFRVIRDGSGIEITELKELRSE
jgi:hypothetical protein